MHQNPTEYLQGYKYHFHWNSSETALLWKLDLIWEILVTKGRHLRRVLNWAVWWLTLLRKYLRISVRNSKQSHQWEVECVHLVSHHSAYSEILKRCEMNIENSFSGKKKKRHSLSISFSLVSWITRPTRSPHPSAPSKGHRSWTKVKEFHSTAQLGRFSQKQVTLSDRSHCGLQIVAIPLPWLEGLLQQLKIWTQHQTFLWLWHLGVDSRSSSDGCWLPFSTWRQMGSHLCSYQACKWAPYITHGTVNALRWVEQGNPTL